MPHICLNMIVKNESARIERALGSVVGIIDSYTVVDTGSTDDTCGKIRGFFDARNIPGAILKSGFVNWSHARNEALWFAREGNPLDWDYLLLMDADMELRVEDRDKFLNNLNGGSGYDMFQYAGAVQYTNRRIVSKYCTGKYVGVTHEYYDAPANGLIRPEVAYFHDHADGANRPEKHERDIKLLTKGLEDEPDNVRYMFYLANTYFDSGDFKNAMYWYYKRVAMGGWEEEVWNASYKLAHCYKGLGQESQFIASMLRAYCKRPTRPETMFDLARHYRESKDNMQAAALACAEAVEHLPKSEDSLFVNDFVHQVGIKEEIAICSFYVPGKMEKGLRTCAELAQHPSEYWSAINTARASMYFYLNPLGEYCPSFKWQEINFEPPEHWVAMNPSVCLHKNQLVTNVRCVNYRIDEEGRYHIRNTETGEITNDNPINTRNFIVELNGNPFRAPVLSWECLYEPEPVNYPLVIGVEDQRLFSVLDKLYVSGCMRQLHQDGNPEQVIFEVKWRPTCSRPKRMLREPREPEKNWSPILGGWSMGTKHFMWRPGVVVNEDGKFVVQHKPPFRIDNLSGSSHVIPFGDGYLSILHIAHPLPGKDYKRYYYHRFITYDQDLRIKKLSLPFYLNAKTIEFVAGMCQHPTENKLVISYGYQDEEARIATVSRSEVEEFICRS